MPDERSEHWALLVLPLLIVTMDLSGGILVSALVSAQLGALQVEDGLPALVPFVLAGVLVGGVLGLGQWAALRQRVPWAGWWLVIAAAGLAVCMSTGVAVLRAMPGAGAGEGWII